MDMEAELFSSSCPLNEQVAQQLFDILPESGPIVVIMDKEGNCWASDSEEFSKLGISESFFGDLFAQIDDGAEPVITQANNCGIAAAQLTAEQTNCGYVIVAMPGFSTESTLANIDIVETLLNQTCLIARLIEANNFLHGLQAKQLSVYTESGKFSN